MSNWIKINSDNDLPKSGEWVLAHFINEYGKGRTIRAYYASKFNIECGQEAHEGDWTDYCEEKDEYFLPVGWYECNEFDEVNYYVHGKVTHWMPLPEAPKD